MTITFPDLARLVKPRGIAIVGASAREGSQGKRLFDNVVRHSREPGAVFPVNPAYDEVGGLPCWPSVETLPPAEIDVALVIVNSAHVMATLRQCADRGIAFAIVMTSGFAEAGEPGAALEAELAALCRETGLRVYGPNCPGFVNVRDRLGMTFSPAFKDDLNAGPIGLATQGGGLGRNVLQALAHGLGVGLWFSGGNEADLTLADFVAHMADDDATRVIAVLMEGIGDGRRLIAAFERARARGKPVVMLKVGRSDYGVRAAQSHTASVAGSAQVNSAVFRQYGVIEVDDLDQLAAVSRLLATGRIDAARGVCVLTFSGGTAALAADLIGAAGLRLSDLGEQTTTALRAVLPSFASLANPVDTTADIMRDPQAVRECLAAVSADPDVGAVLFPIPMDYGPITEVMARALVEAAAGSGAVIVPVWMSRRLGAGFAVLEDAGLQPFFSLGDAVAALRRIFEPRRVPPAAVHEAPTGDSSTRPKPASEAAAKALLRAAGIAVPEGRLATTDDELVALAASVGFPVVLKVASEQILHKTEAGGVRLGLASPDAVRAAAAAIRASVAAYRPRARIDGLLVERMLPPGGREVLVGVHRDDAFGLVMTFGLGGIFVEVLKDVTHRALPVTAADARAMVREIRSFPLLAGARGQPPADLAALEALLVQVSDFAVARAATLRELDLNPVWVGAAGQGAVALDALLIND